MKERAKSFLDGLSGHEFIAGLAAFGYLALIMSYLLYYRASLELLLGCDLMSSMACYQLQSLSSLAIWLSILSSLLLAGWTSRKLREFNTKNNSTQVLTHTLSISGKLPKRYKLKNQKVVMAS